MNPRSVSAPKFWPMGEGWPSLGSLLAVAAALVLGLALAAVAGTASWRAVAVAVAALLLPLAAVASGNARVFCLWLLLFTLPFDLSLYLGGISNKGGGERAFRIEISDLFIAALLAFQARDVLQGRWPGWRLPKLMWWWVLVMGWGVVTVIDGPYRTTAAHELVRMLKVLLLFIVVANELRSPQRIMHAAAALALAVLFQAAFGLAQYVRGQPFGLDILGEIGAATTKVLSLTSVESVRVFRISAFLGHPNLLGIFMAAALPMAIGLFALKQTLPQRSLYALAAGLGTASLILTQSRSGWASFALAMVVLLAGMALHRGLSKRSMVAGAGIGSGLLAVALVFQDQILRRLFDSKGDATIGRATFIEDAQRMIEDGYWWGWGLNSYVHEVIPYMKFGLAAYDYWVPPVHHIYYLWWAETGLIGLLVHLALWLSILIMALRNWGIRDERLFVVNLACLAGLLAFAVDGFLSFSLRVNQPARLYFLLAGIVMAIHYWRVADQPTVLESRRRA
jgi:putative inorganic carbon (hco3(-)) transporter